jgi:hypothetical protein
MNKKIIKKTLNQNEQTAPKTTYDRLMESMTPKQRKNFDEEYQELLLSELLIAITNQNEMSVRTLAKLAGVSPTIIQSMRSGENKDYSLKSFFRVLKGMGYNTLILKKDFSKKINLPIPNLPRTK